ncbi:uncharacterized protein LOC126983830 [Eriocheir sinensis]|uniref:uncharacterized protein LOC126983830 n=1 Tax=Eriocheir sinensis TaxID=95602 RepID=UPI0021CAC065|nr:uncharacterized protein LOC126983830 [Eriocheir sinensis]
MPSAGITTLPFSPDFMTQVDQTLRTLGFDLKGLVKAFDLKTFGLVTLVVVAAIILFDIIHYGYASYAGETSSYTSYGRSLATSAAKIWDQREQHGFATELRNGRGLDSMTQILDSIADAIIMYDKAENNEVGQTRKSEPHDPTSEKKMPSSALIPIMNTLQESLRSTDLRSWISGLDLKTGGLIVLVVVAAILLLDLFTKSYAPYGRSVVASAAQAWLDRDPAYPVDSLRGSRSLEPMTEILDALALAATKWGDAEEDPAVTNRAL